MGISQSFVSEWDNAPKTVMAPINHELTKDLAIQYFRQMANHQIPLIEDFCWVCREATRKLKQLPNHVEVTVQPTDRLILVGDMHGCFEALIRMFLGDTAAGISPLGFPGDISPDGYRNIYMINGDMVDRGGSGYQIIFALALFVAIDSTVLYINRGNHESEMFGMSIQPGMGHKFMFEIQQKFPTVEFMKYKPAVADLFCSLPICHTFDQNIFVVHGGVPQANDMSSAPTVQHTSFMQRQAPSITYGGSITPYLIQSVQNLSPTRFQTLDFEDAPRSKNILWHQFLWSYDRLPYSATFMDFNNYKTMVNSHTATPFHFITTFLPAECNEKYSIQSVINDGEKFEQVKKFFDENPALSKQKLSILEIFTSPTNQGQMYAAVVNGQGGAIGSRLDYDPLHWTYKFLGSSSEFKFVQQGQSY